jgi:carboxymethylenebutenolidase
MRFHRLAAGAATVAAFTGCSRGVSVGSSSSTGVPSAIAIVQQDGELPASANTAAARLAASPRKGEWVKIPWNDGKSDSLMAWIVKPQNLSSSNRAPVVVVVHEIFGLSTWVRSVADEFAARGFIAIAPDLASRVRGGPTTEEWVGQQVGAAIRSIPMADRNAGIVSVAKYAMNQPNAIQKYGVVGFCWGGTVALLANLRLGLPAVSYYGARNVAFLDEPLRAPMQFHFGQRDSSISPADVELHRQTLPNAEIYVDPTGHAFDRDVAPKVFDADSARLAHARTLAFFDRALH